MTTEKPMDCTKLLPCPFCGDPPETKEWMQGHHTALRIWCDNCSVETRAQGVKETIIEKWNTRPTPTHIDLGELKAAFRAGFGISREGYNTEYMLSCDITEAQIDAELDERFQEYLEKHHPELFKKGAV